MQTTLFYSLITLLFTLLSSSISVAEIYSWVDEKGKKHFGDKIPEQYQQQASEVTVKTANSIPLKETNNSSRQVYRHSSSSFTSNNSTQHHKSYVKKSSWNQKLQDKKANCAHQKSAYYASRSCFDNCRMNNGRMNGSCTSQRGCKNVKKPHCD